MKKVAIVQSNYVPWKGYFDLIASVDEFVLYDDMQYTRRDWRNRNVIKSPQGLLWLTVPVKVKGKYLQTVRETEIDGNKWARSHWHSLVANYRRSKFFCEVAQLVEPVYQQPHSKLSDLNREFIRLICEFLGIKTQIRSSDEFELVEGKTQRLVDLCVQLNAGCYVSGPSAREYLNESEFSKEGMVVEWFDYSGYPEYPQLWGGEFIHAVSILDLLFNCGKNALSYMKAGV